ncbi:DoxX family protein [Pseudonocardia sp. MH-G8]|uniref:DoxX family protein n=1 Tax=Pseudonocardia sp. MH-G8 TaxID=1854588 RepID=UPI000BA06C7D|nr:DoxX family protein [Pseudonocardia sp. MH-G8]OZM79261.1 DoxX family protein [Pseudonocardia sp. MH-G8]
MTTSTATPATRPASRAGHRALWVLQILMGVFFVVVSAAPKFVGDPYAVQIFTEIGAGQWFRYVVGALELAGGIGLLVPRLAGPAALGLMALMIGAGYTQAVVLDAPAMLTSPAVFFVLAAVIAWGRRASITAWIPGRTH